MKRIATAVVGVPLREIRKNYSVIPETSTL